MWSKQQLDSQPLFASVLQSLSMHQTSHLFFSFVSLTLLLFDFTFAADSLTPNQTLTDGQTLVSSGNRFELGFFSPGNSSRRYLGVWYIRTPAVVVWVANRNNPITGSGGFLTMSSDGELAILNRTGSLFWSSNTSTVIHSPIIKILDTGNLVVMDVNRVESDSYVWQSFDYLTDTRLPGSILGQRFVGDRDRLLSSWKSADDPSIGNFVYRFDHTGLSQLVIEEGSTRKYSSGPWNGLLFSGIVPYSILSIPSPSHKFFFDKNKLCGYYLMYNSSDISRLVIGTSGILSTYVLDQVSNEWKQYSTKPDDQCDNYGVCGVNGFCRSMKRPICECLKGFTPKHPQRWEELNDFTAGCVRSVPLTCGKGDRFYKLVSVKMPDMLNVWINTNMNRRECKTKCLSNCSCTAYTSSNISEGGSGCVLWYGDLIDIRDITFQDKKQESLIYMRLPASEFGSDGSKKKAVMAGLLSATSGMLILGGLFWSIFRRKRMNIKGDDLVSYDFSVNPTTSNGGQIDSIGLWRNKTSLEIPLFSFSSVSTATDNFSASNKLGEGGFGPVYKGHLRNGHEVAVKRLSGRSKQGCYELRNEAMLIAKLQHRNLVKLVGCCVEGEENILIYEYLSNKSLDMFLFEKQRMLDWRTRVNIIEGVAQGLLYLHEHSRLKIIHRDLKASNILLDEDMNPKISDFGMARIFGGDQKATGRIVGTYGYMAPEYALEGVFSVKSDVFSFGVVLLEILSGKKTGSFYQSDYINLLGYAWELWMSGRPLDLKDPKLHDMATTDADELLIRHMNIALLCIQEDAIDRPTMSDVVSMLSNEHALPCPKRAAFSNMRGPISPIIAESSSDVPTVNLVTTSVVEAR